MKKEQELAEAQLKAKIALARCMESQSYEPFELHLKRL